ncbi:ankyrin repeat domain-containing protein [Nostoc muscorum FACHB-395]|nr:ankyrin repeat domain-containing protein [Desmonostoc muscorum FACHB-395]
MTEATSEALLIAINEGNLEQVCALLDAGANPNTKDSQARHALVIAAELGSLDIVEVLLAADANLIIQGYDALWAAACNGHVDVVKALVAAGVPDSCTLVYAYEQADIKRVKNLIEMGVNINHCIDNMTPLGVAANHDEIALLLISEGANVNF